MIDRAAILCKRALECTFELLSFAFVLMFLLGSPDSPRSNLYN